MEEFYHFDGKRYYKTETEYWKSRYEDQLRIANEAKHKMFEIQHEIDNTIRILNFEKQKTEKLSEQVKVLVFFLNMLRQAAREDKEFELADSIRTMLKTVGIEVHDKPLKKDDTE